MTDDKVKLPLLAKGSLFFFGLLSLLAILYLARGILIPIIFAVIIAILLHPAVDFFLRLKINKVVAILISIIFTFLFISALGLLIISQISRFSESLPLLADRFAALLDKAVVWASGYFDINPQKINDWVTESKGELLNTSNEAIGQTLKMLGNGLVVIFLLPVYTFLLLLYQPHLIEFIHRLFGSANESKVSEIVSQIKNVIQKYLIGLVIEAGIMATLNTTVLLILGIQYALLLGILSALVNIIPYIGGIIGVALPVIVALATKTSGWYAVYVLIGFYIIQLVDNNYIVPRIVASKVKINALFSIIVVFIGNALWGVPGMFLSIPLLAIMKLIFDQVEKLKPWGFLLGDTMPPILKIKLHLKKEKGKT